jgi:hypothetical protein
MVSPTEIKWQKKPVSLIDQFDNYGTSYRSIGNIQNKNVYLKAVANWL